MKSEDENAVQKLEEAVVAMLRALWAPRAEGDIEAAYRALAMEGAINVVANLVETLRKAYKIEAPLASIDMSFWPTPTTPPPAAPAQSGGDGLPAAYDGAFSCLKGEKP